MPLVLAGTVLFIAGREIGCASAQELGKDCQRSSLSACFSFFPLSYGLSSVTSDHVPATGPKILSGVVQDREVAAMYRTEGSIVVQNTGEVRDGVTLRLLERF